MIEPVTQKPGHRPISVGFILNLASKAMVRGWWWIKDPEELYSILQALHPRGVRERVLHKHLAKHMENLAEVCTQPISGESQRNASPILLCLEVIL